MKFFIDMFFRMNKEECLKRLMVALHEDTMEDVKPPGRYPELYYGGQQCMEMQKIMLEAAMYAKEWENYRTGMRCHWYLR